MTNTKTDKAYIKIHIPSDDEEGYGGETVWAVDLGMNMAKINNIPFTVEQVSLDDVISYTVEDGIREFKSVLKKVTKSWGVSWEPTDKDDEEKTSEEWILIRDHLKTNNVDFESACAGLFVIALPVSVSDEKNIIWLKALRYSCPIALTLHIE